MVEAVRSLNQEEKSVPKNVLGDNDLYLTDTLKETILERQAAYNSGNMETYSFDELKSMFKYSEE